MRCALACLITPGFAGFTVLHAQDAPAAQPAPPPPSSEDSSSQQKPSHPNGRHFDDFLVRGTVFTQEGLALPGAELRIRRANEKKFHWDTTTNSRGEFAVRVKLGADYEVFVRAKGFAEQSMPLDAKTGERVKDIVFRMQHQEGKKS